MIRPSPTRLSVLSVLSVLFCAGWLAGPVVAAQELWRGSPNGQEHCRLALSSDSASVEILAMADGPAILTGTGSDLGVEASVEGESQRLRVSGDGAFELRLPAGCDVAAETVTGAVTYWIQTDSMEPTTVRLATSGEITVDESVDIDYRHHQEPSKHGTMLLGAQSEPVQETVRQVELTSRRGAIRVLYRSQPPELKDPP